jgi:hypothetical protein
MLTRPMLNIRVLFTNYDIITDCLNLTFCSEHFISIKHRILATFDIIKTFNSDSLCAFKGSFLFHHIFYAKFSNLNKHLKIYILSVRLFYYVFSVPAPEA